jgi:hypothetical protein
MQFSALYNMASAKIVETFGRNVTTAGMFWQSPQYTMEKSVSFCPDLYTTPSQLAYLKRM